MAWARLWVAALGLAAGSALGFEWRVGPATWALGGLGAAAMLRRRTRAAVLGLAAVAFALGWCNAAVRSQAPVAVEILARHVPRCEFRGEVMESAGGLGTFVAVERLECDGFRPVTRAGVVVTDPVDAEAGSSAEAEGWLLPLSEDGFDRARRRLGAGAELDASEMRTLPPRAGPLALAAELRHGLREASRALEPERGALLRGLAVGDVGGIDERVISDFRRAGLSHLLAVSGSNVAIVLGGVALALGRLPLWWRLAGSAAALVVFVLVVGPEPSVLRAAAMGAVGLLALAVGRRAESLHALALAVVAVVGLRPGLALSVGLHLSAAATAGIVLWARPLARRLEVLPSAAALGLGATVAAQIAVAPVVVGTFGELSVAGPVTNLLALPAVPIATVAGITAAVMGVLHQPLGELVAAAGEPFVAWILWLGTSFGRAEWASVRVPPWVGWSAGVPVAAAAVASAVRRGHPRLTSDP